MGDMKYQALIQVEGVLVNTSDPEKIVASAPIDKGIVLYRALSHAYSLLLATNTDRVDRVEHWAMVNALHDHVQVFGRTRTDDLRTDAEVWERQIDQARMLGTLGLVVTSNPELAAAAMAYGVTALLFAHPTYQDARWRPDATISPRPWDSLVAEQEAQARLYADDNRK